MQTVAGVYSNGRRKKIIIDEEAISEMPIADTRIGIKNAFRLESRNNKH